MAGVTRLQYTTEIRLIRVMCSGRVDLEFILRAFSNGMDGVFIGGCHLGECNYITHGNYHALNVVLLAKRILEKIGVDPERLQIKFMSSGEGGLFAEVVDEFTRKIRSLGPLGKREGITGEEIKERIAGINRLIPYIKIATREKLESRLLDEAEYEGLFSLEEVARLIDQPDSYFIDPEKCKACGTCLRACPAEAIEGAKKTVHVIDQDKCIRCGTCLEVCPTKFSAVRKLSGQAVPPVQPAGEPAAAGMGK